MNINVHASMSCVSLLQGESSFTYLDKGATSLVFEKDGLVYKVPYNSKASDYGLLNEATDGGLLDADADHAPLDGFQTAVHEAHLLTRFNEILEQSGISEFRPLMSVSAKKLENPELIAAVEKKMRRLGLMFKASTNRNGVVVSEKVQGRTLDEIIRDPDVSVQEIIKLVNRFNQTLVKLHAYLHGTQTEFKLEGRYNLIESDELNNFYIGDHVLNVHSFTIDLVSLPGVENKDTSLAIRNPLNVIVEGDYFVLVDPK